MNGTPHSVAALASVFALMWLPACSGDEDDRRPVNEDASKTVLLRDDVPTVRGPQVTIKTVLEKNDLGCLAVRGQPLLVQSYYVVVGDDRMTAVGNETAGVGDAVAVTGETVDLEGSGLGGDCFPAGASQQQAFKAARIELVD